ncbi:MAG: A24 family peptidase [Hyphomonadaceae bacterium]|nr:A24 family peptidase [Hyphomonadaceae bacterium]
MMETPLAAAALGVLCLAVAAIDLRTRRIPDTLNLTIAVCGFVVTWARGESLVDAAIGAVVGYGAFWAMNAAFRRLRGRDALGMGDAKFLAASGAWTGWAGLPFIVLIAAASGLAVVAGLRLMGRTLRSDDAIAFGPFLAAGALIVWLVGAYG